MKSRFILFFTLLSMSPSFATTYSYTGGAISYSTFPPDIFCNGLCVTSGTTATVSFHFDTSTFSGSYSLGNGDVATVTRPWMDVSFPPNLTFPATYEWLGDPGLYGIGYSLNGTFQFEDGKIVSWDLAGGAGHAGSITCGGGPACTFGDGFTSSPNGDFWTVENYPGTSSGSGLAGVWLEVAAVPEPSTWALALLGFCGVGFLVNRHRNLALSA